MDVATVSFLAPGAGDALVDSLRGTGFAVVTDHPIPYELVEQVHAEWARFFASPGRNDYLATDRQDGYYPPDQSETAVGAAVPDLKEFFHWYPWGQSPPSEATAALHRAGSALAATLLGWIDERLPAETAASLSMPLHRMLDGSTRTLLRILHYPPLTSDAPPGAVRAAGHEDVNLLTVLPAATAPGLEALRRDGTWVPVVSDPGSVVVNVGDALQLATRGWLTSTRHRVVNPDGPEAHTSRYSTPLFLHPADDVRLDPDWTALEFLQERIRRIRGIEIR